MNVYFLKWSDRLASFTRQSVPLYTVTHTHCLHRCLNGKTSQWCPPCSLHLRYLESWYWNRLTTQIVTLICHRLPHLELRWPPWYRPTESQSVAISVEKSAFRSFEIFWDLSAVGIWPSINPSRIAVVVESASSQNYKNSSQNSLEGQNVSDVWRKIVEMMGCITFMFP